MRVNGGRIKPSYRLQLDRIRIPPVTTKAEAPVQFAESTQEILESAVIYEDADLMVLNKPSGFAVHGGSSIASGVIELMREMRGILRLELAHRIDRDTSGCLLICKRRSVLVAVQEAFRQRSVKKRNTTYSSTANGRNRRVLCRCGCNGMKRPGVSGVFESHLRQIARTDFSVIGRKRLRNAPCGSTAYGRTHQIRVHTQSQEHPILGDSKYGQESRLSHHDYVCMRHDWWSHLGRPVGC